MSHQTSSQRYKIEKYKQDMKNIKTGRQIPDDVQEEYRKEELQRNVDDEERFVNYNELLKEQREAEDLFQQKQQEFNMQATMEMGKINQLKVKQHELLATLKKMEQQIQEENSRDQRVAEKHLQPKTDKKLQRVPKYEGITPQEYVEKKRDIYQRLKDTDIRELYLEMKGHYSKYNTTKYADDSEESREAQLDLQYDHKIASIPFYQSQPYVEAKREKILYMLGEIHNMASCLHNLKDLGDDESDLEDYRMQRDENEDERYMNLQRKTKQEQEREQKKLLERKMKQKSDLEEKIGERMRENELNNKETYKLRKIDEEVPEKDINKPKIWNYNKSKQYNRYDEQVDQFMKMKENQFQNKYAQLFEDQYDKDGDITIEVKNYLRDKFQKHGVTMGEYKELLPQSIPFDYNS